MGKKKGSKKASADALPSSGAGSSVAAAKVALTEGAEDAVRALLASQPPAGSAEAAAAAPAVAAPSKKLKKRLDAIYGELAAKGFTEAQVQAALAHVAAKGGSGKGAPRTSAGAPWAAPRARTQALRGRECVHSSAPSGGGSPLAHSRFAGRTKCGNSVLTA